MKSLRFSNASAGGEKASEFAPPVDRRTSTMPRAAHEQAELLAKKKGGSAVERFLVKPDYAYPNTRMNRDELRLEMNKPSEYYHDLRLASRQGEEVGLLKLEILQCFGLPKLDALSENDAFCLAVCGSYAFKTDIMPPVANPMWLSKMRRACIFPLFNAYARLYVGVFDDDGEGERDDFAGRVVLDISRMRPRCTYDVTLPLRQSGHVYMRRPRGAVRIRFHVNWYSEQAALLSYLSFPPKMQPHESVTVNCCDKKSFQNVALVVHGTHPPGRFSMKMVKALIREINFTRIHILRYMRKREMRNLVGWQNPIISGFLFVSWMHSVYANTVRYVPGNLITFFLLYLWKNYANFLIQGNRGFLPPTWEEMFLALLCGKQGRQYIQPLEMTTLNEDCTSLDDDNDENDDGNSCDDALEEVAVAFQKGVKVSTNRYRFRVYRKTFVGSQAVDFLVDNGYADSREEAVAVGRQLAQEKKLFEHVTRHHEFKDANLFYHFLIHDDSNYSFTTHKPRGKSLFRMLGFLDENRSFAEHQLEMPYSNGSDHPRLTVKESLVIRSKESKSMFEKLLAEEEEDEEEDDDDDAFELGMEGPRERGANEASRSMERMERYLDLKHVPSTELEEGDETRDDDTIVTVKQLKKPPLQDIDYKAVSDRPITDVLAEARDKVHGVLLHSFNDRTYVVRDGEVTSRSSRKSSPGRKKVNKSGKSSPLSRESAAQRSSTGLPESQDEIGEALRRESDASSVKSQRTSGSALKAVSLAALSVVSLGPDKSKNFAQESSTALPESQDEIGEAVRRESDASVKPLRSSGSALKAVSLAALSVVSLRPDKSTAENKTKRKPSKSDLEATKEENDRLLKTGAYSNANRWIAKIGVIVQPIVEIAYEWLCLFRALFNIFTWRDPMLSFWVSIIGPVVVVVLHLFPWRIVFGVTGVLLWGPQNWVLRVIRERKGIPPPDLDKIIRRKKKTNGDGDIVVEEEPVFCNDTDDNQPVDYSTLDASNVRHIAVPYSPLMYNHRFYDWPPEPEYARVTKDDPQSILRTDDQSATAGDRDAESTYTRSTQDGDSSIRSREKKGLLRRLPRLRRNKKVE